MKKEFPMAKEQERQSKAQNNRSKRQAQARRENMFRFLGIGALALLVIGVVFIGFVGGKSDNTGKTTSVDRLTKGGYPTSVNPANLSWSPNANSQAASTLTIWEDFQCPACRNFEQAMGATIEQLAADDVVKVEYRMTAFLDVNFPQSDYASHRAINAYGCAIEAGFGQKYHDVLYINQPAKEGDGWTDEALVDLAKTAGYSDLAGFGNCVYGSKYMKWGSDSYAKFQEEGISGTPTILLDGKEATADNLASVSAFLAWIQANKK
jgi:protein-disulfide isomerase